MGQLRPKPVYKRNKGVFWLFPMAVFKNVSRSLQGIHWEMYVYKSVHIFFHLNFIFAVSQDLLITT